MDTRQIQIGLRHLVGGARGANMANGFRRADVANGSLGADVAGGVSGAVVAGVVSEESETREALTTDGKPETAEPPAGTDGRPAGTAFERRPAGADGRPAGVAGRPPGTMSEGPPRTELADVPNPVAELLLSVRTPSARRQLEQLIGQAGLHQPEPVEPATAERMVRPYSWLLDRVGDDGIKLTDAGHLPPAEVAAVIGELNLAAEGITRGSRENQAPPALQLRESAQATGLVRRDRGRLVLTTAGEVLRRDPVALWWHLAQRMPLRSAAVSEVQPGLILLACVAARCTDTINATIARMLTAIGWVNSNGVPLTGSEAASATSGTRAVLRRLGALPPGSGAGRPGRLGRPAPEPPTPEGVAFAHAALLTWPVRLPRPRHPGQAAGQPG
jgi:hypothetical protein